MSGSNAIEIKKLNKRFGKYTALNNVSFDVPEGQIFGFLGPNGAGKTTTIRCIMDFIKPTRGSVKILGLDAHSDSAELKKSIGYLSADYQLNSGWTGQDHISLFEKAKGNTSNLNELIELLDLNTKVKVKTLSSGNKQKLAVVLALIGNPRLLIMDEPTRGLDPVLQNNLYDLLKDFVSKGNTVFLSSHNLAEVQRNCDSVVLIKNGRVITEQSMNKIRGLKIHLIEAKTAKPIKLTSLKLKGVEIVEYSDDDIRLKVHGDLNQVLHVLTKHNLLDLNVEHASLEDVFLEHYKG